MNKLFCKKIIICFILNIHSYLKKLYFKNFKALARNFLVGPNNPIYFQSNRAGMLGHSESKPTHLFARKA